ncbi:iron chelate uptake ABC transporter family permease subunit [Sulfitobacter sp. D35]|uniref:iron chelate uptake ABC transporter family permease subunit n=1 Tax=Sulfitobacter sp. D35 TaxID=3083252 RepID=UPI00296E45B8|nr:iron chelate uptake ABC transporter family permease subunit [Sulfitobacter sp. D35]MDW4498850.1 iron chelate uptake ABC transporter family permease subunit [Sulfitobacter sp. D35]
MLDDFMTRATLAGIGVACAAAPLGSFVVWRRMAYFGDATAHAAILGVALSLALQVSVFAGALAVALAMALTVTTLTGRGYAMDTLLGVLAHSALAFGLVAVSFLSGVRIDLMSYLFGDILAVSVGDLIVIWGGVLAVVGLIAWRWSALLTSTLSEELAYASGIDPRREQLVLTLALAITVAVAIKVVGALLIAAMLIIPAAAARPLSRTPEQMAIAAAVIGGMSAVAGLWAAYVLDTPAGPSIVCVASLAFLATRLLRPGNSSA